MAHLRALTSIFGAPEAPSSIPDEAVLLVEIEGRTYRLPMWQVAAVTGGNPTPGPLHLEDGVTQTGVTVEYADSKYQFVSENFMVCLGNSTNMMAWNNAKTEQIFCPFEPFSTDGDGFADAVALGTPVHAIVVTGQEIAVTGGTVTLIVTNNVVSATFTPD